MEWLEISFTAPPIEAEIIAETLREFGHQGISIEQLGIMPDSWDDGAVPPPELLHVRAFIHMGQTTSDQVQHLEQALKSLVLESPVEPVYTTVDDQDWAEAWKVHYHPIRIGQRILIRPRWIEVEAKPDDIVISLDPGMAFGTGTHPTTQLCLMAIEDHMKHGIRVLDLGCGSGILSIAAAKLGAMDVLAIDNDEVAVITTVENAHENGVADKITAQTGSLESVLHSARRFDLIVVNILARIIVEMCANGLGQTVRPGGMAIFSGLVNTQAEEVEAALRETGLQPTGILHTMGDWVAIEAFRPHGD